MVDNQSSIQININRSNRFTEEVADDAEPDPDGHLKILVNDEYLVGSDDSHVSIWITTDLIQLLAQTEAVVADEKDVVAFPNGPSYLVVEPIDKDGMINVTQCLLYSGVEDPDQRLPIEETFTISKCAWIEELTETAKSHLQQLIELNPDLEKEEVVQQLRQEINKAENRLEICKERNT